MMISNSNGVSTKISGTKTERQDFIDIVFQYDIVCLSELHTKASISIPGFILKKQKFRVKKNKGPKIGGGIAVFIKSCIYKNFKLILNTNEDSIWIKSKTDPIHLGFYYCSPEKYDSNFSEIVGNEIETFSHKGSTYIFGDFNARTKTVPENILVDKFDKDIGVQCEMQKLPNPRNSEDTKLKNKRGNEFLDLCRLHDLCIANGRILGDIFGKFTCHQKRGSSVVDYLITHYSSLNNIQQFTVGDYDPILSDHCYISACIRISTSIIEEQLKPADLHDLPSRFYLTDTNRGTFENHLKSSDFLAQKEKIMNSPDHPELIDEIEDILFNAAKSSGIKKSHNKTRKPNLPWFDEKCASLKKQIQSDAKSLRKSPLEPSFREKIYIHKKQLRNIIRKNKYLYKKGIIDNMCTELNKTEQKMYWRQLRKLDPRSNAASSVPDQQLIDHFKDILFDKDAPNINVSTNPQPGTLDNEISLEELKTASKILKAGKLPGLDIIPNEMLSPLVDQHSDLVLKLFNSILSNIRISKKWLISIISAIHKKGAKDNPDNYRGISLMSCLGKLFLSIINNRITEFVSDENILSSGQLGFWKLNRTSDPHIILNNICQKYCHRRGKKVYGCFVDFSKAFDSVPRDILMSKLESVGINGRVLEIIKTIYAEDQACVKIGNKCSAPFRTNMGVRQGCVLSPILFNIFLSDIQLEFDNPGHNPMLSNTEVSSLLWADDILILSTSAEGLQQKLDNLKRYCLDNKLKVNTEKTKIMIFNKSGRNMKDKFLYGKTKLENVRQYKYLGFCVTPSGEIKSGLEDLRVRALKALTKIRKSLGSHFHYNIRNTIHLFNYMIRPILLYCGDFWGCLKHPKNSPISRFHMSFCKQLLGVCKQTSTNGVLLELGLTPILFSAIKATVKNWERIRKHNCNKLLLAAYNEARLSKLPWATSLEETFARNGMLNMFSRTQLQRDNQSPPHVELFQRLVDQFHQNALSDIKSSSKLNLFSKLKKEAGREKYLYQVENVKHRQSLTRYRLSSHSLSIETGRHRRIERDSRICPFCVDIVEDEVHFLLECPSYNTVKIKYPDLDTKNLLLDNFGKISFLMDENNIRRTASLIHEAFVHREIMIDAQNTISDMIGKIELQEKKAKQWEIKKISSYNVLTEESKKSLGENKGRTLLEITKGLQKITNSLIQIIS